MKTIKQCLFVVTVLSLFLTACGSSMPNEMRAFEETFSVPEAMSKNEMRDTAFSAESSDAFADSGAPKAAVSETKAQDIRPKSGDTLQRKLIESVNLNLETRDFDTLMTNIRTRVDAMNGYVENSFLNGDSIRFSKDGTDALSGTRSASLTVRVPAEKLETFLSELSNSAHVLSRTDSVRDVTLQYSDLESHKKSLNMERERLWELMSKADSIDAVIALQTRIGEIEYELDSYESQLRLYDNQISYATVTMEIEEVERLSPARKDSIASRIRLGFSLNVRRLKRFSEDMFVAALINLPFVMALLVPILIFVFIVTFLIKRKNRKASQKKKTECSDSNKKETDTSNQSD